jgi:hypothetical protein
MKLTAENVDTIFRDCLFDESEFEGGKPKMKEFPIGEGVVLKAGFHPTRLLNHTAEIIDMLSQLPIPFGEKTGGGWTFLNACMGKDEEVWGEHSNVDQLLTLGLAIGKIKYTMPRDMWKVLPGGLPYFTVME